MGLSELEQHFAKCTETAKDPEKYTGGTSSGLRGIVFRALDALQKEKKGKTLSRAGCIRYLATVTEVQTRLVKDFPEEKGGKDAAVHRLNMYGGFWAKKRKIKSSGEQGTKKWTF